MTEEKCILHSDMNSFYASVEMMLNPSLRGKPVAVCGATEDRHGIVLAKSELAKKAGVKTGMVNWEAERLCKDLILVPPHYDQYLKYSKLAHEIYYRYTDLVEPFGMDECWLDVTSSTYIFGSAMEIAEKIRKATREELGLTVSIGVSFNKIFAKLGSDMKKPDAITEITRANFKERVWPLPASDLLYVGRATTRKLESVGIHTIGDLAAMKPDILKSWFGVNGLKLYSYANGTDVSRVCHKEFVSPIKSVGHGITCNADLENENEVGKVILELSQDIGHKLRVHELTAKGVALYIRTNDLFGQQYQCKLPIATRLPSEIASAAFRMFKDQYNWRAPVRAVCVRAINLDSVNENVQLDLYNDYARIDKLEDIQEAIESIRGRFGKKAITYGSLLGDLKMPGDGRELVRMPSIMFA